MNNIAICNNFNNFNYVIFLYFLLIYIKLYTLIQKMFLLIIIL